MDHPFWRKSFKVESNKELQQFRSCGIDEIWIDTNKGYDLIPELSEVVDATPEGQAATSEESPRRASSVRSAKAEHQRAAKLLATAQPVMLTMFAEARMGNALNVKEVGGLVMEIESSVMSNADALLSLARLKTADNYTYMHSIAVCALMIALAKQLGMSAEECRQAGIAGLLHDVGKIEVSRAILNKPAKLTDGELESVRTHTLRGYDLLKQIPEISESVLDVVLHHHEKVDGTGYPHNLKGNQISLMARMCAICDVYDAITSNRPYKVGWDPAHSIRHMANCAGHFDPAILNAFIKAIGIYPSGACVLLKSGRLAVVVSQDPAQLLTPCVKVFFSTTRNMPIDHEIIDLSRSSDRIVAGGTPEKWGVHDIPDTSFV